jgi:hypothetical protein
MKNAIGSLFWYAQRPTTSPQVLHEGAEDQAGDHHARAVLEGFPAMSVAIKCACIGGCGHIEGRSLAISPSPRCLSVSSVGIPVSGSQPRSR